MVKKGEEGFWLLSGVHFDAESESLGGWVGCSARTPMSAAVFRAIIVA
jgi:hypothetical protein